MYIVFARDPQGTGRFTQAIWSLLLGATLGVFTVLIVYLSIGWTIDQTEESLFITVLANIIRSVCVAFYLLIVSSIIISIYYFIVSKTRYKEKLATVEKLQAVSYSSLGLVDMQCAVCLDELAPDD
jgi:hypothetical protein